MSLSYAMRATVFALLCSLLFVTPVFAATSTGAVLIPGILNDVPKTATPPAVVKPPVAPKPVAPTPTPTVSKSTVVSSAAKTRSLSRGMRGADVLAIQQALITLSFLESDSATGYFGPLTEAAVKNFQAHNNIVSSGNPSTTGYGVVGPRTRSVFASGRAVGNSNSTLSLTNLPASVATQNTATPTSNTTAPVFATSLPVQTNTPVTTAIAPQRSCVFQSQTIAPGAGVFAYAESSVAYGSACIYELRMCENGQLSGTFQYTTCSQLPPPASTWTPTYDPTSTNTNTDANPNTAASCVWNGSSVASGNSVSAFQAPTVPSGSQCVSESRVCSSGTLSGTYQYATCGVNAPSSCTFNGQTIANGASVNAYQSSSVAAGGICATQSRVCNNGTLSGTYQFASCSVLASTAPVPANCAFNGATVAAGASIQAYQSSSVAYGTQCVAQARTCTNGQLSGSYAYSLCEVAAPASCIFNGSTVGNGVGVTAYQAASVPAGQSCISQIRNCSNGTLSGSYQYANCSVAAPATCSFNGQTIASGASVAAFQSTVVGTGGTCVSQTRTCTNGTLSGSSAYAYDRCSVQSSSASLPNVFVPATFNGVGVQLHAWYATPSGSGPYPVVVLAHGCNGLNPDGSSDWSHQNSWASLMREWGYATLIVDSFTARGYPNGICSNSSIVNGLDRALDLYSAATVLARTPNVNAQKIGVFGSSHGGNGTEVTLTTNRYNTQSAFNTLNAAGGRIAAGASLYPICDPIAGATYYSPLFVAAGADDNWDSPAVCKSLTNYPTVASTPVDLSGYGALLRMIVYQNATHAFDIPGSTKVTTDSSGHTFAYNPTATTDLQTRIRSFFDSFLR